MCTIFQNKDPGTSLFQNFDPPEAAPRDHLELLDLKMGPDRSRIPSRPHFPTASPNAYIQKRLDEYPAWGAQLDKIYHNGIDAWKADIKKIKDKYPKPE